MRYFDRHSEFRNRNGNLPATLVSLLAHMLLIIALGLATLAAPAPSVPLALIVEPSSADGLSIAATSIESLAMEMPGPAPAESDATDLFERSASRVPEIPLEDVVSCRSTVAAGTSSAGDGSETSSPGRGKAGAGFFGIGGRGKSFVYVIDCSGSMNDDGKFDRAREELLHSLASLSDRQRYFVILYNQHAFPMDADGPLPATPAHLEQTRQWLYNFVPDRDTHPQEALLYALSLEPDAIYFLSDGQFDPQVVLTLRFAQKRSAPIPIHTIAFGSREGEGLMRTIARNSKGKFRFVP